MHGGDSLFGRMTSTAHVYRDSGVDAELDHKAHKVTEKLSECINTIANEPSVAFYRIQEHVRKTLPQLVEQKHEVEEVQQLVQGACFDTEYAGNAVKGMQKSVVHFQNIQELLKNAMFMKQQIDYEEARKRQSRVPGGNNGRQEGQGNGKTTDSNDSNNMDDSAVSTDSSLVASGHANTEEAKADCVVNTKAEAETDNTQERTDLTEKEDTREEKDSKEKEDMEDEKDSTKNVDIQEEKNSTEREDLHDETDSQEVNNSAETKTTQEGSNNGQESADPVEKSPSDDSIES